MPPHPLFEVDGVVLDELYDYCFDFIICTYTHVLRMIQIFFGIYDGFIFRHTVVYMYNIMTVYIDRLIP